MAILVLISLVAPFNFLILRYSYQNMSGCVTHQCDSPKVDLRNTFPIAIHQTGTFTYIYLIKSNQMWVMKIEQIWVNTPYMNVMGFQSLESADLNKWICEFYRTCAPNPIQSLFHLHTTDIAEYCIFRICPNLFNMINCKTFINSWRKKITGPNPVNSEKTQEFAHEACTCFGQVWI